VYIHKFIGCISYPWSLSFRISLPWLLYLRCTANPRRFWGRSSGWSLPRYARTIDQQAPWCCGACRSNIVGNSV
jgi:hypothetical protein